MRIDPHLHWLQRGWHEFAGLYWGSGLCDDVPALSWFLIVSLVPLSLGLTALAALLLGDYAHAEALAAHATRVLPRDVHDQIVLLVLRTHHDSPALIAGAVVAMVWVSSGAVGVVERCLSRLLRLERSGPVSNKLRSVALATLLAIVIVLLVLATSAGTGLAGRLGAGATLFRVISPLVSLTAGTSFCALLYRVTSGGAIGLRPAFAGGAVGGLVLLLTPTIAGYYLSVIASRTPVGLFLTLSGVLFTVYIVALGLLLGAGVSARVQLGHPLGEPTPTGTAARADT